MMSSVVCSKHQRSDQVAPARVIKNTGFRTLLVPLCDMPLAQYEERHFVP